MKCKVKLNSGITLIALIVTIIVLLILAGVAIVTLTGENGILERARLAKEETEAKTAEEQERLNSYENEIDNYASENRGTVTLTEEEYEELKEKGSYVLLAHQKGSGDFTSFTVPDLKQYSSFVFQVYDGSGIFETIQLSYDDIKSTTSSFYVRLFCDSTVVAKMYYESDTSVKIMNNQGGAKLYGVK